jgi:hypothetical protein
MEVSKFVKAKYAFGKEVKGAESLLTEFKA